VDTKIKLRFKPISHSWVAIHPQAKGVIQFIGGAFFGTFGPTFFYRHLLKYWFEQGYTIIVLPFAFTFNHYKEAGFLIREQYDLLPEIIQRAKFEGYTYEVYLDENNFSWIGHSLGCKYISLLEGFGGLPDDVREREKFIRHLLSATSNERQIQQVIRDVNILIEELKRKRVEAYKLIELYLDRSLKFPMNHLFIKGQQSILLAPDISSTSSAIKPKFLANFIDSLGLGVKPSPQETFRLIEESHLFNLLVLVCFTSDKIAVKTCNWFMEYLEQDNKRRFDLQVSGKHLRPLGVRIKDDVFNIQKPIIQPLQERNMELEDPMFQLLTEVRDFQERNSPT
jgi:hypothetical protein